MKAVTVVFAKVGSMLLIIAAILTNVILLISTIQKFTNVIRKTPLNPIALIKKAVTVVSAKRDSMLLIFAVVAKVGLMPLIYAVVATKDMN